LYDRAIGLSYLSGLLEAIQKSAASSWYYPHTPPHLRVYTGKQDGSLFYRLTVEVYNSLRIYWVMRNVLDIIVFYIIIYIWR
jgi:hypothetical protein